MGTFRRMSRAELLRTYPSKAVVNEQTISIARDVIARLWNERCEERGTPISDDRSGSCKFAALIAREIFGGQLAGNDEHVFVVLGGVIIDLNRDQADVKDLGSEAYLEDPLSLLHPDYRDAMGSCVPRASKWAMVALQEMAQEHHRPEMEKLLYAVTVSPLPIRLN